MKARNISPIFRNNKKSNSPDSEFSQLNVGVQTKDYKFMKDLVHLRDTQESIQGLSAWAIKNRKAAYKIARCWLKCIKKGNNHACATLS